ncbi:MAG: TadE/TadG family type IV pilus assembly protein [Alphaproteobacteria bacterium]
MPVCLRRNCLEYATLHPRSIRRFVKASAGVTAVEFAMIAPVFIMILFGTLETSIMYYVATSMEGEVQIAARQVRTGNIQNSADPLAAFRAALCSNLGNLATCGSLVIDVRTFPDFGAMDRPPLIDEDGNPQNENFEPGGGGDVVLVRIAYRYPIMTPFLGQFIGTGGGHYDLYAAAAFQNEPYDGVAED